MAKKGLIDWQLVRRAKKHEGDGRVLVAMDCECEVKVVEREVYAVRHEKCERPHEMYGLTI